MGGTLARSKSHGLKLDGYASNSLQRGNILLDVWLETRNAAGDDEGCSQKALTACSLVVQ